MKQWHRSPRPILLFVGVFLVCLVASILLVMGLRGALGKHFAVGGYEDIGNVIGSTVGLSAGLAAAFVAIIIANLANNMLQEEKRREEFAFVNQIIEEALAPINKVANKLDTLHAAMIMFSNERDQLIKEIAEDPSWKQHTEKRLGGPALYKRWLVAALVELADALEEVQLNPYSFFIWTRLGGKATTIKVGPNDGTGIHVATGLGEAITILRMWTEHLNNVGNAPTLADVLVPNHVLELTKIMILDAMNLKDPNDPKYRLPVSLRDLLKLGGEIGTLGTLVGFFILVEIHKIMPDTPRKLGTAISGILEFIKRVLPDFTSDDLEKASPLLAVMSYDDCNRWIGSSFKQAVDAYLALPESLRQALQPGS